MQTIVSIEEKPSFDFWKNLLLVAIFFSITPITIAISIFSLFSFKSSSVVEVENTSQGSVKIYASLPSEFPTVSGTYNAVDARPELIRQYLIRYNSPLVGLENYMVEKADEYGLDYRLIPAIGQQESNLCKIIPPNTYNCWGWGIHSRGTLGFNSYEEAIDTVMRGLKKEYIDKGLTTPDTIWTKYTPNSPDGAWAKGVNQFMMAME
ncbi:MAG: hypothetical protein QY322_00585 [bacterium]|nr:MAG: hypothetical protein QY322_00585 [bacterium]